MPTPYATLRLSIAKRGQHRDATRDLQRDLRALGYLARGIDGNFGDATDRAVRALQIDLNSADTRPAAPVAIKSYAGGNAIAVSGEADPDTCAAIEAMLNDSSFPRLPRSSDPGAANRAALATVRATASTVAPAPFMAAIFEQESTGQHFRVPVGGDEDNFVTIGLDRNNAAERDRITSRGYGLGQFTIKHHPPTAQEIDEFIVDPVRNVARAFAELREKHDGFVLGPTSGTQADDRLAELPLVPLRPLCKYARNDTRYMNDCRACARAARALTIADGAPVHSGAALRYEGTQYHREATYTGVPDRSAFACDWPYAVRRYNGSGVNSYHYQTKVLLRLINGGG